MTGAEILAQVREALTTWGTDWYGPNPKYKSAEKQAAAALTALDGCIGRDDREEIGSQHGARHRPRPPGLRDGGEVSLTPEREAEIRAAWRRGRYINAEDLLAEIDRLRAENERLRRELANSMPLQYPLIRDWREASSGAVPSGAVPGGFDSQPAPETIAGISRADLHRPLGEMR